MRRFIAAAAVAFSFLLSSCSADDVPSPDNSHRSSPEDNLGIEPCVELSDVRALIADRMAVIRLDTNLKEQKDKSGFASRYCVYTQVGTPSREILSITTYREPQGHPAFNAVSRLYNENIPGSVRPLDNRLPELEHAAKADVIESKEKNSTGVLINIQGATYTIMVPYSLTDATKKAQRVVVRLMTLNKHDTAV